jgi:hypothetical protein
MAVTSEGRERVEKRRARRGTHNPPTVPKKLMFNEQKA